MHRMTAIQDKMKVQSFMMVRHRFGGMQGKGESKGGMWDYRDFKGGMQDENARTTSG